MSFVEWTNVLANLGEFVGAIAVVVTLFYLATQVRLSKEATEANTRSIDESRKVALAQAFQGITALTVDLHLRRADSPIMVAQQKYAESGIDSLDPVERKRLQRYIVADLEIMKAAHYLNQQGLLPIDPGGLEAGVLARRKSWEDFGLVPLPGGQSSNDDEVTFEDEVNAILSRHPIESTD